MDNVGVLRCGPPNLSANATITSKSNKAEEEEKKLLNYPRQQRKIMCTYNAFSSFSSSSIDRRDGDAERHPPPCRQKRDEGHKHEAPAHKEEQQGEEVEQRMKLLLPKRRRWPARSLRNRANIASTTIKCATSHLTLV